MAEYITKEALRAFPIRENHCDKEHANEHFIFGIETVMEYAEGLPAADVVPVVHGRWIVHKPSERHNLNECIECSECNTWFGHDCYAKTDFCPNCGAKMDLGGERDTETARSSRWYPTGGSRNK